jgi:hypothetical protein
MRTGRKEAPWATSEPKTTTTTTSTTRNALPSTPSVFKEEDNHINDQGNNQTTRANNPVQEILAKDNKANNSNPSLANVDIAKSKVTIRRIVVKEKQLKPQWSTETENLTPTRLRHSSSPNSSKTTTGVLPPSLPLRLILII